MKNVKQSILLLFLVTIFFGCGKDDPATSKTKDVYVAGYSIINYNNVFLRCATLWKNGEPLYFGNSKVESELNDIFVVGSDVYAVGYDKSLSGNQIAKIWKNGVASNLSDGLINENALAIKVVGSDIYVLGRESKNFSTLIKFWKNGVATNVKDATPQDNANGFFVFGNDVYMYGYRRSGTETFAKYWKNGIATELTTELSQNVANDLLVSNNDLYVVGRKNGIAKCWKNNILITNLIDEDDSYDAKRIMLQGKDFYVVGNDYLNSVSIIKLWKNGVSIDFPIETNSVLPSDMDISGSDIYVSGNIYEPGKEIAAYWKNQVKFVLSKDSVISSTASAIFVTK